MQGLFRNALYADLMAAKAQSIRLKELRETAGLSLRELARRIGEDHSNVRYWETSGNLPRSDVLIPMAKALGVSVEQLLGEAKPKLVRAPKGKIGEVFESVTRLPRRQQQKIAEVVKALVAQHGHEAKQNGG
jgi:transcriptional regulator with XRE-family HTH domain